MVLYVVYRLLETIRTEALYPSPSSPRMHAIRKIFLGNRRREGG